jgi:hypothetical protein
MNINLSKKENEELKEFIDSMTWTFAKTMPNIPHWYIVWEKMATPKDKKMFYKLAEYIFKYSVELNFSNRVYRYFLFDGRKYWSMDKDAEGTGLINMAYI